MQKDLSTKMLFNNNDVFSDIMNVLVYNGEQIIKENELIDKSTNGFYFSSRKIKGIKRDVSKLWKKENVYLSCLSIENQTNPDTDMPLRIIGYDGATYRAELKNKSRYPSLSLVLYFGYNKWNTSKSLYDCFDLDENIRPFINDYKINLIEVAYLEEEQIDLFKSDFKIIAQYFVQKRKYKDYKPSDDKIKHIEETLTLLSAFSDDKRFIETYLENQENGEGGLNTMCEVLDRIENRGIEKGIEKGLKQGIEIAEKKASTEKKNMLQKLIQNLPIEQVAKYLDMTVDEIQLIVEA